MPVQMDTAELVKAERMEQDKDDLQLIESYGQSALTCSGTGTPSRVEEKYLKNTASRLFKRIVGREPDTGELDFMTLKRWR